MYVKLSIPERLKDLRVVDKHLTLEQLAEQTGLSKSALGKYESNDYKDISPFAIATLAQFYGVSTDYLMGLSENKNPPNAELQSLHLNDDMIELLRSGRINNRLLCEIALHPGFRQMLTDIEVCVDRIADMHIQDMNKVLEMTRQKAMEKYGIGENDLYLRTMELAQVSEDIFYSHIIQKELDVIIRDIRSAHKTDSSTADTETDTCATVSEVEQMMRDALAYDGTIDQKRAFLVCQTLKINYDRLPEDEQDTLGRVCKKSPLMLSVINQRGKALYQQHGKGKRKKK